MDVSRALLRSPVSPVSQGTWITHQLPRGAHAFADLTGQQARHGSSWCARLSVAVVLPALRSWRLRRRTVRQAAEQASVQGKLPYQADHVERSLKFQGVGSVDGVYVSSETVMQPVTIKDGRNGSWNLDDHGFTRVDDEPELLDFYNEKEICKDYYPQCERLVKKVTGAAKVHAFYHTVRSHPSISGARERQKRGFPVEAPAASVHVDYSKACAARLVRQFGKAPHQWQDPRPLLGFKPLLDIAETDEYIMGNKRWAIINVWRNLSSEPVQRTPVALCVGTSASLDDIVTFQTKVGRFQSKEYYFAAHSENHDWYYFPQMKREEAILIKNWDSIGKDFAPQSCEETVPCTFAFHSAFEDPNTIPQAPLRETMEVRTVAFW
eukprot:TRINITY_DN108045_c0_g1_i1.p1 TRINITY_DN108045_c0_g1~~TRINITY_DN108045_c0_g1_i1.p1  ORF type:complete len:380 (-),score=70.44 TRINITY_DN108045_c0_g1_i1:27-1166(-)